MADLVVFTASGASVEGFSSREHFSSKPYLFPFHRLLSIRLAT